MIRENYKTPGISRWVAVQEESQGIQVEADANMQWGLREFQHPAGLEQKAQKTQVTMLLENAIKEAVEVGRSVYLVVIAGSATRTRLEKLKLLELLPEHHVSEDREEILRRAVGELPVLQEV